MLDKLMLNGREKDIMRSVFSAWVDQGYPLFGHLSYESVEELLVKFGFTQNEAYKYLPKFEKKK